MFNTLHTLFQTRYTELALAVDEIAERMCALHAPAPGSYAAFSALTAIKEETDVSPATTMIETLAIA